MSLPLLQTPIHLFQCSKRSLRGHPQEKQQQLDAFFRQDELSRLNNQLQLAQERNNRDKDFSKVKKLQGEIERCKKGSKSREPPFKVAPPDVSSNEVSAATILA